MRWLVYQKQLRFLIRARKGLLVLCAVLLVVVLLQSSLLFFKHERIILMPPQLKQSVWVENHQFSESYLEEMALFFTHLLLDVSEANVLTQGEVVLRYVEPHAFGRFKSQLLRDEKQLKKQQLSLQFYPQSVQFQNPLVLHITGVLKRYVGSKKISEVQQTYQIEFSVHQGRLWLSAFEVVQSNQEPIEEETHE